MDPGGKNYYAVAILVRCPQHSLGDADEECTHCADAARGRAMIGEAAGHHVMDLAPYEFPLEDRPMLWPQHFQWQGDVLTRDRVGAEHSTFAAPLRSAVPLGHLEYPTATCPPDRVSVHIDHALRSATRMRHQGRGGTSTSSHSGV